MTDALNPTTFDPCGPSVSRRGLMLSAGAAGLAWASGAGRVFAAAENVLRVGFISPRTGPLGQSLVDNLLRRAAEVPHAREMKVRSCDPEAASEIDNA